MIKSKKSFLTYLNQTLSKSIFVGFLGFMTLFTMMNFLFSFTENKSTLNLYQVMQQTYLIDYDIAKSIVFGGSFFIICIFMLIINYLEYKKDIKNKK